MNRFSLTFCVFVANFLCLPSIGGAEEQSPWSIYGTVRDVDGNPISDTWVSLDTGFTGLHGAIPRGYGHPIETHTDADGNYTLPIPPFAAFSKLEPNEESDKPPHATDFRF